MNLTLLFPHVPCGCGVTQNWKDFLEMTHLECTSFTILHFRSCLYYILYCWNSSAVSESWQKRKTVEERRTDLWSFWMHFQYLFSLHALYSCLRHLPAALKAFLSTKQVQFSVSICTHLIFPVVDQEGQEHDSIITMLPSTGYIWQNLRREERENRDDQNGKKKKKDGFKIK